VCLETPNLYQTCTELGNIWSSRGHYHEHWSLVRLTPYSLVECIAFITREYRGNFSWCRLMNGKGVLNGCAPVKVLPWRSVGVTEKSYEYFSHGGIFQAEILTVWSGILVREGVNAVLDCLLFLFLTCHMPSQISNPAIPSFQWSGNLQLW